MAGGIRRGPAAVQRGMTEPQRSRFRRIAREVVRIAAFALVLMSARSTLADHYTVPSGSMEPTIETGDRIFVNKAAYGLRVPFTDAYVTRFDGPALGDVVVLDSPEEDKVLLKRVVGTPGTRIEVRRGRLLIDGEVAPIEERADGVYERLGGAWHPLSLARGGGPDFGPLTIPDGQYLVMGDNRGDSHDGRAFGFVQRDTIFGRAVGVYWRGGPTWDSL
jgi:signal peptidase I